MTSSPEPTDAALVARIAGRHQEALSSLYDRYRAAVFALALRILKDRAEAEDVLIDVFHQTWQGAPGYDPQRGSVSGWLFTLCRSRAIDRLRARSRRAAALDALALEEKSRGTSARADVRPEDTAGLNLSRRLVGQALGGIAPAQRAALELAYYEGLSHSEIATRLGEPLGTVKTRIRQGLLALRESLGAHFER